MPLTLLDTAGSANSEMLETFMEFPVPLALLDADGHPERVNFGFQKWFGIDGLDAASLRALAQNPNGVWRSVATRGGGQRFVPAPSRSTCRIAHY